MKTVKNVDQVLPLIGEMGLHQIMVMVILCLLMIPGTMQALIIYFVAYNPPWKCAENSTICTFNNEFKSNTMTNYTFRCDIPRKDWVFTEESSYSIVTEFGLYCEKENLKSVATSIFFAGMAIGSIVIGWLADKYGRIRLIIPSTIIAIILAFASSFSPSYWVFAASRFVIGFLAPGINVMFFILASEIVGSKYRPATGITLWIFFTLALVLLGVIAMYVRTWKMLMIYCTAPYFILLPFIFFIPESLRWLHVTGRLDKAHAVIKNIAKVNGKSDVQVCLVPVKVESHSINPLLLFSGNAIALKSINIGFAWMVNGLVYYGVSLTVNELSGHLYRDYILSSLVELPAAVIAIFSAMYFGRKRTTQIPLLIGGIFCAAVSAISEKDEDLINLRVVLGLSGKFFMTLSYDVIYTWTVELYPTQIRTEAMGYVQITSRIGAMLSPWYVEGLGKLHPRIPYAAMGILAIIASLFLQALPETKDQETAETYKENESGNDQELNLISEEVKPAHA